MSQQDIDNWMHASDDERRKQIAGWDLDKDEGREIAEACAALLEKECVYDVNGVGVIKNGDCWQIHAYAGDDYESLKARQIEFLGFELVVDKQSFA